MIKLHLNLHDHSYQIYIGTDIFSDPTLLLPFLATGKSVIVTNSTVAPLYLMDLEENLKNRDIDVLSIILPDGENYKNWQTLTSIFAELFNYNIDRDTTIIALGGGVIGDLTGFAAACYLRGVPYIQIPTTLLAQVDSSVGGKTAINFETGKNMVGAFYQPSLVLADTSVLTTLRDREFSAGLAEVIKYAVIGDLAFFNWLETNMQCILARQQDLLHEMIAHCCRMKAEIVSHDEKESGSRVLLNFGHTFGHAIESGLGYGKWLHGEAVAVGMLLASSLSLKLGRLKKNEFDRMQLLLYAAGLPTKVPTLDLECWIKVMQHDKKNKMGKIRFIIPERIGQASVIDDIPFSLLQSVLIDPVLIDNHP